MLTRQRGRALSHAAGFSLIELLVVLMIIGLLAAIAVPLFLSQRGKAYDAGAKEIARAAQTAEEVAYTDGEAYVSQAVDAGPSGALNGIEPALVGPSLACPAQPPYPEGGCGLLVSAGVDEYQVSVVSQTGVVFKVIRSSDGAVTRVCDVSPATDGGGGCERVEGGVGSW